MDGLSGIGWIDGLIKGIEWMLVFDRWNELNWMELIS